LSRPFLASAVTTGWQLAVEHRGPAHPLPRRQLGLRTVERVGYRVDGVVAEDQPQWRLVGLQRSKDGRRRLGRIAGLLAVAFGASSKDVGDGTIQTLARAVPGFLDTLGANRVHLVGHSMGGAVVTAVAADPAAAGRVASLTLISAAGFGPEINAGYLRGFAEAESRRELKPHLLALFADPGLVNRQLIDDLLKYKRLDGVDRALRSLVANLVKGDKSAVDVTAELAAFGGPAVAVWGREDKIVPAANAAGLGSAATVHIVDGAGHMAHMEKPHAVCRRDPRSTRRVR
jgi:pimeloyl-ACP methyl ester carboxylesterase